MIILSDVNWYVWMYNIMATSVPNCIDQWSNCIQKDIFILFEKTQISKQNLFDVGVVFLTFSKHGPSTERKKKNGSISSTAVLLILQVNVFFYSKILMKNIVNNISKY